MVKDQAQYVTIFQPDIKSYLSITIFTASDCVDHLIHEDCPTHEDALARSRKQYSVMRHSGNDATITMIVGICRDAACGCGGMSRTDLWRDGKLYQWHGDDAPSAMADLH
jgi:hypothetical protein